MRTQSDAATATIISSLSASPVSINTPTASSLIRRVRFRSRLRLRVVVSGRGIRARRSFATRLRIVVSGLTRQGIDRGSLSKVQVTRTGHRREK